MRKSWRKFKKYLETNDNEDTTSQNLWDGAKAVLRGKLSKKKIDLKYNNLTLHLNGLEKEEQKNN